MSKTKGNVIDPREIIDGCTLDQLIKKIQESELTDKEKNKGIDEKKKTFPGGIPACGSDSLRFSLLAYM